jgi:tetratricopeptide (TPR) repeat protein
VASIISVWLKLKTSFQAAAGWVARSATFSNVIGLSWIVIFIVIGVLVVEDLARDVVTIEPISVPKTLSDNGYTPEVASHRLLDALKHYASVNKVAHLMESLNIAPSDEVTDFVVPKIDLSLNALVSSIRSVLHYGSGRRISGELVFRDKLGLRLRVDGQEVYSSGFDFENPDDLLANAAPAITERIQPYVSALVLYHDHPEEALERADDIIANPSQSDVSVQWAYILKGQYYYDRGKYAEAESTQRKAISLNWSNPTPHNNLGRALQHQNRIDEAIVQFQRALSINPRWAVAHDNLGIALSDKAAPNGSLDAAIAEYRRAIDLDRRYWQPHNNLGLAYYRQGKVVDAIAEFQHSIALDPKSAIPHNNLGMALYHERKAEEAIAEFHQALALDAKNPTTHDDLGLVYSSQGKTDDAIAEYRRAIEILPGYKNAHDHLEKALEAKSAAK